MDISVCLATYNGEKYILDQVKSILSQLTSNSELIISDDSSKDDTLSLLKSLEDERIKIFHNTKKKGYVNNFENAISKASGELIFLADQDDVWMPGKVELMRSALEHAHFVVSDAEVVDENLKVLIPSHFAHHGVKQGFMINYTKTRYIGACMAFRKEILKKAMPFPDNSTLCVHDYWLALIAEFYYKVQLVDTPLLMYRRHGKNASTGGSHSTNSFYKILKTRAYVLFMLLTRFSK
jgi:glycosyltransferase involved in cell wall biosynthesis